MSEDNMSNISSCASCGIAEVDDIKLKECDDCDLVRYCSDACQQEHKSQHKEACNIRTAELRDEILFKQPESRHDGDCPICCLPMPLDASKSIIRSCCSKVICNGCNYANKIREIEGKRHPKCPFCRKPSPSTVEACDKMIMKRIEANDPVALRREGVVQYRKGDHQSAFQYFTKAAELGDAAAHYYLSVLYDDGHGVEKDKGKEIYHLEEAAIGGHPYARFNLGIEEEESGNIERAVKHFIIAATQGHDKSIKELMGHFKEGFVSKDELAATLRAHQAAVDATKSPQRDAAEEYYRNRRQQ
eukprot:scaffold15922_cov104-Skeletonema_dohrnii-CCMP3373.AAC.11